ncbi:MAG: sensor histidine kinase [Lachnospiraceae bacterium]|nr:sensor histidine kinase [Lachnospiraceae bacterium]
MFSGSKDHERSEFWDKNTLARGLSRVILFEILFIGVTFIIVMLVISKRSRREYAMRESEALIVSSVDSINASMGNYKDITRLIMLNEAVADFLKAPEVNSGLVNDTIYGVMDILNVCNDVDSVFIFRNDGEYMKTGKGNYDIDMPLMNTTLWKSHIMGKRGGAVISLNADEAIFRSNGMPIITIGRSIYDIYTQKLSGVLLMNISINMLNKVSRNQAFDMAFFSEDGEYLTGNMDGAGLKEYVDFQADKGKIIHTEKMIASEKKMISYYAFEDVPIVLVCVNTEKVSAIPTETIMLLLVLLLAFVFAMIMSTRYVSNNINKPISGLTKAMEETRESGWMKRMEVAAPENEIGKLAESYNSMIEYLNDLFKKLIEEEKSVQKAEMRVLQEQIKPHFLYNSLETISFMALDSGAQDVYGALETLGSFYRNFLSKGDREIPVKREVGIVKDYLALQKLRYGDIIKDEYEIAEDTEDLKIPKLILQPLVENSIYHGIRPKGEEGIIRIITKKEGNDIVLSVYDTGIGMPEEAIKKLLSEKKAEAALSETHNEDTGLPSGFGLRGTIERLRIYCNRSDIVSIESEEGEYTRVTFTIPEGGGLSYED